MSDHHGTGVAAAVPIPPLSGKAGAAEFGKANPPKTPARLLGFRCNVGFASGGEDGGMSLGVTAPQAATCLSRLPAG